MIFFRYISNFHFDTKSRFPFFTICKVQTWVSSVRRSSCNKRDSRHLRTIFLYLNFAGFNGEISIQTQHCRVAV